MTRLRITRRVAVALALVALLMGAEGPSGCEQRPVPDSDRPARERVADENVRTVHIRVTRATGPYDLWVRAHEVGDAFACEIVDGDNVDRDSGKGQVTCQLTTSR